MEKSCVQTYNQARILARCCILEKYIVIEYEQIDGIYAFLNADRKHKVVVTPEKICFMDDRGNNKDVWFIGDIPVKKEFRMITIKAEEIDVIQEEK